MEKILIVDDDEGLIHFLGRFLSGKGYEVKSCTDGRSALDMLEREPFDLVLLDYKMAGLNGLDTLKLIRKSQVKTPVIIMTAYGTTETAIEAMKLGAYDYLLKPFEREDLDRIVRDALEVNRQMKELVSFPDSERISEDAAKGVVRIIGNNKKMQEVYKLIGQVAEKDVNILVTGESGTGKELVARAVYQHSHRSDKPFLTVNCAAIPDTLFESELFGHERGAFTGAEHTHMGRFERCNHGTLFFDEIGDMSLHTQAKVLRALQEGEIERLGGTEPIKVDVRVIAATNKNLEKEVERERFREDLYWRLKIISIELPPLRKRMDDIEALTDYFVEKFGREYKKPVRQVSEKAMKKLKGYSWPGNVRELENCIRRAVLLCGQELGVDETHIQLDSEQAGNLENGDNNRIIEYLDDKLDEIMPDIIRLSENNMHSNLVDIVERKLISRALKECGNNQVKAAKMLGMSRNTLRHRMKKYKLQEDTK